ncbi:SiaB family protein kinase [Roseospira goensis]|uniref:Uncharacterized protein n=1 Tax=Roseospira goensis TaxID=391922 RepID=A0A7W6WKT8_9PROT|nr:SiaB family protein kinase [Roseospira goensis]MBB4286139.1 hypothetical protein [Roseospira goensis]
MTTWATDYNAYRRWLTERGIIFSFAGYLSEDMLTTLGKALKTRMALAETDANVAKRVFSVFVEQVQNIIRYSSERVSAAQPPVEMSSGIVSVGFEDDAFFVVCGNIIEAARVPGLRERLEHLAGLTPEQLKAHYREKLREPPDDESQGASIGLIEIARRSSAPIAFDIVWTDADRHRAFFVIKAYI